MKKVLITVLAIVAGFVLTSNVLSQGTDSGDTMMKKEEMPMMDNTMKDTGSSMMMDDKMSNEEMNADKMEGEENLSAADEEEEDIVAEAEATIQGTSPDSKLNGFADLIETKEGVYVDAEFYSAPPGKHGFHVHENGSCEDSGNAAGGHFNPDNVQHGYFPEDGSQKAHPGDMGNAEIDENGEGYFSVFLPGASLSSGKYNVLGKAIVLHEKEDDMSQPTGNAGSRIGCGVIEKVEY